MAGLAMSALDPQTFWIDGETTAESVHLSSANHRDSEIVAGRTFVAVHTGVFDAMSGWATRRLRLVTSVYDPWELDRLLRRGFPSLVELQTMTLPILPSSFEAACSRPTMETLVASNQLIDETTIQLCESHLSKRSWERFESWHSLAMKAGGMSLLCRVVTAKQFVVHGSPYITETDLRAALERCEMVRCYASQLHPDTQKAMTAEYSTSRLRFGNSPF